MTIASETKTAVVTSVAVTDMSDFSFTEGELAVATRAWISGITNSVNVTWSGADPTASLGHPVIKTATLTSNEPFLVDGKHNVANIKLIGLGGSATVTITIER